MNSLHLSKYQNNYIFKVIVWALTLNLVPRVCNGNWRRKALVVIVVDRSFGTGMRRCTLPQLTWLLQLHINRRDDECWEAAFVLYVSPICNWERNYFAVVGNSVGRSFPNDEQIFQFEEVIFGFVYGGTCH